MTSTGSSQEAAAGGALVPAESQKVCVPSGAIRRIRSCRGIDRDAGRGLLAGVDDLEQGPAADPAGMRHRGHVGVGAGVHADVPRPGRGDGDGDVARGARPAGPEPGQRVGLVGTGMSADDATPQSPVGVGTCTRDT